MNISCPYLSCPIFIQYLALSLYAFFMGFCFCDGFKLHILRKLLWFAVFGFVCIYVFRAENEFNLALILPIPTLLAILLCSYEKRKSKGNK